MQDDEAMVARICRPWCAAVDGAGDLMKTRTRLETVTQGMAFGRRIAAIAEDSGI